MRSYTKLHPLHNPSTLGNKKVNVKINWNSLTGQRLVISTHKATEEEPTQGVLSPVRGKKIPSHSNVNPPSLPIDI